MEENTVYMKGVGVVGRLRWGRTGSCNGLGDPSRRERHEGLPVKREVSSR